MNRIVRKEYSVSKLPEDLRQGFAEERPVSITIEQGEETNEPSAETMSNTMEQNAGGDFSRFKHLRQAHYASSSEVDAYLHALRDAWAHRER